MTLVEGVYSLPPGHRIVISAASRHARIQPEPYWEFAESAQPALDTKKPERNSAAAFLRLLLEETVDAHLVSDVPVGVFLSGGIDSTVLVALAAMKRATVHTITLAFQEHEFNEGELARRTAQRFGTKHQELALSGDDMLARLNEAVAPSTNPAWTASTVTLSLGLPGRRALRWRSPASVGTKYSAGTTPSAGPRKPSRWRFWREGCRWVSALSWRRRWRRFPCI